MPSKKHKPEEIIGKLREVEIVLGQGGTAAEACRRIAVSVTVPRFSLQPEGEHPALIGQPGGLPRQQIRGVSSSPARCEDGSRYSAVATLRSWPGRRPETRTNAR